MWGAVVRNIVLNFERSVFKKVRGGQTVLQVDIFQKPCFYLAVILWGGHLKLATIVLLFFFYSSQWQAFDH